MINQCFAEGVKPSVTAKMEERDIVDLKSVLFHKIQVFPSWHIKWNKLCNNPLLLAKKLSRYIGCMRTQKQGIKISNRWFAKMGTRSHTKTYAAPVQNASDHSATAGHEFLVFWAIHQLRWWPLPGFVWWALVEILVVASRRSLTRDGAVLTAVNH